MIKEERKEKSLDQDTLEKLLNPWKFYQEPFKIIENIYFVGNKWVSVFLLDTDEGLILIDCSVQETLYLLVHSINELGYSIKDISKLFITHGHFDHCGAARAIQELSNCEIWIGKEDSYFFTENRELIYFEDRVPEFKINNYYDYTQEYDFGNMIVKPVHSPGHTPGTTSFLIKEKIDDKEIISGIYGGLGSRILTKENLEKYKLPISLQEDYCKSIDEMIDEVVHVTLPSHPSHYPGNDYFNKVSLGKDSFIDPNIWQEMLSTKKGEMMKIIQSEKLGY